MPVQLAGESENLPVCDVIKDSQQAARLGKLVLIALLMMAAQHGVRLRHQSLRLRNAFAQAILARFDLGRLLLSPGGALFGIRHPTTTLVDWVRAREIGNPLGDVGHLW